MPSIDTKRSICSFSVVVEQLLHAAQIAEPFLADVGDERDRARRLDVGLLHLADDRDHHREAAAVVADARSLEQVALALHLDVGAFGEHRVEMRREHEMRMRGRARIVAEHVADLVDAHVLQPELREDALQLLRRAPLP